MKSTAGTLPDLLPRWPRNSFASKKPTANYAFVGDRLADLGHQWWFSAT